MLTGQRQAIIQAFRRKVSDEWRGRYNEMTPHKFANTSATFRAGIQPESEELITQIVMVPDVFLCFSLDRRFAQHGGNFLPGLAYVSCQ
jgi:hypothetical protein